jgi:hypothetical protein
MTAPRPIESKTQEMSMSEAIRRACYTRARQVAITRGHSESFDVLKLATDLAAMCASENDHDRAEEILERGYGDTAQQIWDSGSKIVAFLTEGTLPIFPQPNPAP